MKLSLRSAFAVAPVALLTIAVGSARAHVGDHVGPTWSQGLLHPLTGLDHLLAMLAVGMWAGLRGGTFLWLMPTMFLGAMMIGSFCPVVGIALPMVEPGIAASVVILGLLVATASRLPLVISLPMIGSFALLHGYAHGVEAPAGSSHGMYVFGFAIATSMLLTGGIVLAATCQRCARGSALRFGGAAIAVAGAVMMAMNIVA